MKFLQDLAESAANSDVKKKLLQLNESMDRALHGEELSPVTNEQVRTELYKQLDSRLLDDADLWHEVGCVVWTALNRKMAGSFEYYLAIAKDQLQPRVLWALGEIRDDIERYEQEASWDVFSGQTMESRYLLRNMETREVAETPTRMDARAAAGACSPIDDDAEYIAFVRRILKLSHLKRFTLATPGKANGGKLNAMLSSCFLISLGVNFPDDPDSIEAIAQLLATCIVISAKGGGIGFTMPIRTRGQLIKGSGGLSKGVVDALLPFDAAVEYADQGGSRGKKVGGGRAGAWAFYMEPHCDDLIDVLQSKREVRMLEKQKKNGEAAGKGMDLIHNLFLALWVSDLFMRRVRDDAMWSFFSVDTAPGLEKVHSEAYDRLYERYEREGRAVRTMRAKDVWNLIMQTEVETGGPYIMFKDACNKLSPQQNLGTIQSSNLCTEIVEYTSGKEIAVCNLASMGLPAFVKTDTEEGFDWEAFGQAVGDVAATLYLTQETTTYPIPQAQESNMKRRPIAIGIQGFAQVLMVNKWTWESAQTRRFNRRMALYMYYYAMRTNVDLCISGEPTYEGYEGSPLSHGKFAWQLFEEHYGKDNVHLEEAPELDWDTLRADILEHGVAMSLLIAPMPTATTATIMGNYAAFEPPESNAFSRSTGAGRATQINRYLIAELKELGLWDKSMRQEIIDGKGSIKTVDRIPLSVRKRYPTVWEISPKLLSDLMLDRAPFVDQAQSFNVWMAEDPDKPPLEKRLTTLLFYQWKKGAKNGVYYFRHEPIAAREAVTGSVAAIQVVNSPSPQPQQDSDEDEDVCKPGCGNCGA